METRHLRFEHNESLEARKNLLYAQLSTLKILKRVKNYKILRKRELVEKQKLKTTMSSLKQKLALISANLPRIPEARPLIEPKKIREASNSQREEKSAIQRELEEIQNKLANLR